MAREQLVSVETFLPVDPPQRDLAADRASFLDAAEHRVVLPRELRWGRV